LYGVAAVSHTFEVTEQLGVTVGASVAAGDHNYHEYYFGTSKTRVSDAQVSVSAEYAFTENFSAAVSLAYSDFLSTGIEEAAEAAYEHSDSLYGGVSLALSF
jgi:outer membrane scaffolding protein for murein synthesis (MipA/OmpV family)